MNNRIEIKALAAMLMSLALYAANYGEARADDSDTRALFYFQQPLAGGHAQRQSTFGFRLDSGRIADSGRWPLLNLQLGANGGTRLRVSGVPVFGYAGEESINEIPWWGWALGVAALACLAEVGICEDEGQSAPPAPPSNPSCPTCDS